MIKMEVFGVEDDVVNGNYEEDTAPPCLRLPSSPADTDLLFLAW